MEVEPSVVGLWDVIKRAFEDYPPNLLNRVWISHQTIMDEIVACRGDNSFKLPHIGKEALENNLIFAPIISVSDDALHVLHQDTIAQELLGDRVIAIGDIPRVPRIPVV